MISDRLDSFDRFFLAGWFLSLLGATILASSKNPISFLVLPISAAFLGGISLLALLKSGRVRVGFHLLDASVLSFAAIAVISCLLSAYVYGSLRSVYYVFALAVVFYSTRFIVGRSGDVRYIELGLLAAGIYEAIWGVAQYAFDRDSLVNGQITGSLGNPGFLADLLMVGFVISLSSLVHGIKTKRTISMYAPVASLLLLALFLTRSRGAAVALFASTGVIFLANKSWRWTAGFVAAAILLVLAFPNPLRNAAFNLPQKDPYSYSRIGIWLNSGRMLSERPIIGVGPGLFAEYSPKYKFPVEGVAARYAKKTENAHNEFLQVAVETGVLGLAAYILVCLGLFFSARRAIAVSKGGAREPAAVGFSASLAGLFAHSLFSYNLEAASIGMVAATLSGCVVALSRSSSRATRKAQEERVLAWSFNLTKLHYAAILFLVAATIGHIARPVFGYKNWLAGETALNSGAYRQAIENYRRALAWEPGSAFVSASLGKAYFAYAVGSGDSRFLPLAVDQLEVATGKNPLDAKNYFEQAMIYRYASIQPGADGEKMLSESTSMLRKALKFDPFNPSIYNELGVNQMAMGRHSEAEKFFAEALDLEPLYLRARYNLGRSHEGRGEKDLALREYRRIIEIKNKYKLRADSTIYDRHLLEFDKSLAIKRIEAIENN